MLETFIGNKIYRLLYVLFFVLSFGFLQAQEKKAIPDVEKVYLHTDNSKYFIGDDLYYKAYDVHTSNNVLFDNSNVLYVELVAPNSKIIARNKTNIEIGLGHGDFKLTDSLGVKPGIYQLRAYTNWNRNFGDDFVFKKNIEIIDVFESRSKINPAPNSATVAANIIAEVKNPTSYRVDFFPEGGSLLENVASIVGFKGVDNNGNPIEVKGDIYDSDNELVTSFSSPHDGMGKFQMIPIEGKNYYAKIKTPDGKEMRQELPKAAKQGYSLSYRALRGKNFITITTNEATLAQNSNAALTVVCKAKGIPYLETVQTLTEKTLSFELPKDKAPEGISQITLFDSNNKPQSERLVYLEKEQDLDVQVATDKSSYQPNEKVAINVSSKSKAGMAKSASFSLSVTDMNGVVDDKDFGSTISSYFLMESDIRGKVNNPGYYFDAANLKRLDHLDDLLLTQGWRDFLWKTTPKVEGKLGFEPEKGITISGRLKQLLGEKPKVNINVTLALMNKKHMNIFNATTDSIGRFKFENIMFSGKTDLFINSRNEKGKFRGEIIINPELAPVLVSFKKEPIVWNSTTTTIVDNVFKKYATFGVQPENILDEVTIVAKKKNQSKSYFGIPENSYIADGSEEVALYTDIFDLIVQKIPGVVPFGDSVSFMRSESPPLFVLNGVSLVAGDLEQIRTIRPEDVEKIEVIKGIQATMFFGDEGSNGFIAIYTKPNTGNKPKSGSFSSIRTEIDGFYTARVFYSPSPEQAELDNKLAVRNTLYWNPFVHPDATGNANLTYYNTKVETKVKVALEGITATGIPVTKKVYYTIKK